MRRLTGNDEFPNGTGLSAHRSRDMRAWVAGQDWLTLERLPAYAPELNPVELLWSAIKTRELANHPATTSPTSPMPPNAASTGSAPTNLPWPFLTHTGLTIHNHSPQN
ncbi:transposase [Streptomyces violaceusniger]